MIIYSNVVKEGKNGPVLKYPTSLSSIPLHGTTANPLFLILKLTSNPLVAVVIITGFVGLKLPKTRLEVPHCSGVVATKFPLVM